MVRFGYAQCAFDASEYQMTVQECHYLSFKYNDPILLHEDREHSGWVWVSVSSNSRWRHGWMPRHFWAENYAEEKSMLPLHICLVANTLFRFLGQANHLACTCCAAEKERPNYVDERVQELLCYFPTLAVDKANWGMPTVLYPLPTWVRWKLRLYVLIPSRGPALSRFEQLHRNLYTFWGSCWFRYLSELASKYDELLGDIGTAGVYTNVSLRLEEWTWDYEGENWVVFDHL